MLQRLDFPISSLRPLTLSTSFDQAWLFGWSSSLRSSPKEPAFTKIIPTSTNHANQSIPSDHPYNHSNHSSASSSHGSPSSESVFSTAMTTMTRDTTFTSHRKNKFYLADDDDTSTASVDEEGAMHGQTFVDDQAAPPVMFVQPIVIEDDQDSEMENDDDDDVTVYDEYIEEDVPAEEPWLFEKKTCLPKDRRPSLLTNMLMQSSCATSPAYTLSASSSSSSASLPLLHSSSLSSCRSSIDSPGPCSPANTTLQRISFTPPPCPTELSSSLRQCVEWEQKQNCPWLPLYSSFEMIHPLAGSVDPIVGW
ncbi:hypothetical protein DM01DRAFT_326941 [Hesseltinella vesiculosa]|uniref:Uncharacterized protein n=1 Tax=Hesseltinella vesiculosa TaxID=101127 RepID=A0A1X2GJZ5_9FUNG|nr:hypothetical protein DM01DRAFT_326941 [Hesseltinella vesiculosa]